MRIALIGSRQLEQKQEYFEDIKLCYNVCMRLAQFGIKLKGEKTCLVFYVLLVEGLS